MQKISRKNTMLGLGLAAFTLVLASSVFVWQFMHIKPTIHTPTTTESPQHGY